jgi:putative tryptophan/tyrosine transport system substrate-binding protein
MRRREFIALLGGAAAALPLVASAQQVAMPVIGFLNGQAPAGFTHLVAAFRQGLNQAGYIEGQNVAVEFRWAEGHPDRLPALADDLIRRQVAAIVATGGAHPAAKVATTTIPIVAALGGDPVKVGLVESINRPGGNMTGVSVFTTVLEAKRLELLHELISKDAIIGVLLDPTFSDADVQLREVQSAARALGRNIRILNARTEDEIHHAIKAVVEMRVGGLAVVGNPFFLNRRDLLLTLTKHHAIPAIYENREFTAAGGLMSYGTSVPDVYRQVGVYAGRILKGEKAADLPILQPTKFDIAINLKTAKSLRLDVPTSILLRADEVIE